MTDNHLKDHHFIFLIMLIILALAANPIVSGNSSEDAELEQKIIISQYIGRAVLGTQHFTIYFGFITIWMEKSLRLTVPSIGKTGIIAATVPPEEAAKKINEMFAGEVPEEDSEEGIYEDEDADSEDIDDGEDIDDEDDSEEDGSGNEENAYEGEEEEIEDDDEDETNNYEIQIIPQVLEIKLDAKISTGRLKITATLDGLPIENVKINLQTSNPSVIIHLDKDITNAEGSVEAEIKSTEEISAEIEASFISVEDEIISNTAFVVIGNPDTDEDLIPDKTEYRLKTDINKKNRLSSIVSIPPDGMIYLFPPRSGSVRIYGVNIPLPHTEVIATHEPTGAAYKKVIGNSREFEISAKAEEGDIFTFEFE